jgi:hypothetical protein
MHTSTEPAHRGTEFTPPPQAPRAVWCDLGGWTNRWELATPLPADPTFWRFPLVDDEVHPASDFSGCPLGPVTLPSLPPEG